MRADKRLRWLWQSRVSLTSSAQPICCHWAPLQTPPYSGVSPYLSIYRISPLHVHAKQELLGTFAIEPCTGKWSQLLQVATTGDKKGRGVDQLAVEGLVTKYTFGWSGESCLHSTRAANLQLFGFFRQAPQLRTVMQVIAPALQSSFRQRRCRRGICRLGQVGLGVLQLSSNAMHHFSQSA